MSKNSAKATSPSASASSTMRQRAPEKKATEEPARESRPYTEEQVAGVRKIIAAKKAGNLYGILGLEKNCAENLVKKAYRKVLLIPSEKYQNS